MKLTESRERIEKAIEGLEKIGTFQYDLEIQEAVVILETLLKAVKKHEIKTNLTNMIENFS